MDSTGRHVSKGRNTRYLLSFVLHWKQTGAMVNHFQLFYCRNLDFYIFFYQIFSFSNFSFYVN